jgi:hypothetical protein
MTIVGDKLTAEKIYDQTDQDTYNDHGSDRDKDPGLSGLNAYIPGKLSKPIQHPGNKMQESPQNCEAQTSNDQHLTHCPLSS